MSIPLYGHVIPTLAIVEELVSRGHRVTYLATGEFTGMLRGAGARSLRYESTWPTPADLPTPDTGDAVARLGLLLASESIVQARCALAQLSGDVPDAIVYDAATSAAVRPLLRLWRCSGVRLFTGVASSERFSLNALLERRYPQRAADPAHPLVRQRRSRLQAFADEHRTGRDAANDDVREDVSLVLQPRPFQIAGELFDDRYVFVGPCVGRRTFQGEWVAPGGGAPLVLVSLGTLYNHRPQFFRTCVEACADLDCHVVLVVGARAEPAELGVLPANVEVHRHVAQLAVLEHARAFVTHGGMGSTMEALLTATPLVVVPQTPEQDAVARRVAELGLGCRLSGRVTCDALRAAVSHALFDEATLRRVQDMQRHAREAGGAARAVDAIEAPRTPRAPGASPAPASQPASQQRPCIETGEIEMTNRLVAIGTKKGLFMARRNGSDSWEIDGPHLLMNVVGAICIDTRPGRPRVLAGTDHGHWGPSMSYSDDLGASWQETDHAPISFPTETGVSLVKLWQIHAAGADQPGVVYAGTEPAALFRSEDGGLTYELVDGLWHHPDRTRLIEWIPEAGMLYLHTVVVDPRDSDTITVAISAGGVYRTTDGGQTWAPSNAGIQSLSLPQQYPEAGQCVHKIAMCPGAPQQLFLQNHGGVYRSDDDGATWTAIGDGLPADFGFPIMAHPQRPGTAYVYPLGADTERMPLDRRCRIYRTRDAGNTWEALSRGLPQGPYFDTVLRDAMCVDDGDPAGIYFGTRGGQVFASEDEGDSWSAVAEHLPDVLCVRAICVDEVTT